MKRRWKENSHPVQLKKRKKKKRKERRIASGAKYILAQEALKERRRLHASTLFSGGQERARRPKNHPQL